MSRDISLIDITTSGREVEVFETNFTGNYSPALREAGLTWAECDGMPGHVIYARIRRAADLIEQDPEKYRPLIGGGGEWGTPELLVPQLRKLADACETNYAARFDRSY